MSNQHIIEGISETMTSLIREDLRSNEQKYTLREIDNFLNDYKNIIMDAAERMYSDTIIGNNLSVLGEDGIQGDIDQYKYYYLDFIPELEDKDPLDLEMDVEQFPGPLEELEGEREGLSQEHNHSAIEEALEEYVEESKTWSEDNELDVFFD